MMEGGVVTCLCVHDCVPQCNTLLQRTPCGCNCFVDTLCIASAALLYHTQGHWTMVSAIDINVTLQVVPQVFNINVVYFCYVV